MSNKTEKVYHTDYLDKPLSHKEYVTLFHNDRDTWNSLVESTLYGLKRGTSVDFIMHHDREVREGEEAIIAKYDDKLRINRVLYQR